MNYIWQNKRPRLAFSLMTKHPAMGGLCLQKLQAYHLALTLDEHWWHNSTEKSWAGMEAGNL